MSKKTMRLWSLLLVFVMIFNMLPLHAMAEEINSNQNSSSAETQESQSDYILNDDVYVIEEIVENRTEYVKEFRLSNGLYMASVYAYPVHYEVNGQWEEIDNTLQLSNTRTGNAYTNTAGIWQVSFPQRLTENNGISITKDGHTLMFRMAGEIHNSGTGNGHLDDSEMVEIPSNPEEPIISDDSVTSANENNGLVVEETEPNQDTVDSQHVENQAAEDTEDETVILSIPMGEVVAAIETIDVNEIKETAEYPETVIETLNSRLRYDNVYENTDVIFDLTSNLVKESIVLKAYSGSLRGYAYTLEVGDMIPVLLETGEIELRDENGEEVIMYMPAPYLIDDAGTTCFDINVSLEGENGKYILAYELPQEWLSAEDRQWPVVLDPAVQPALKTSNIRDRTVCAVGGYSNESGTLLCGYYGSNKVCRIYVKYLNLPALTAADMIVSADMRMRTIYTNYNSSKAVPIMEVHKVNGVWESQTITWANKPDYDPTVEDYVVASVKETYYNWDVTDLVRGWYEGENTGMMFKMSDSVEAAANVYSQFYSSDYSFYESDLHLKPTLTIIFRNNNGLEGYWDYTTSSAGRAGTGYVNQYTGNMVWTRNDIGFGGNRMPVTIGHVYNTNDSTENQFGMGNGWRTNFNQMVYHWDNENAYSDYYVWEDSDGTDHYFYYESANTYKDEDGLELTLTTNGTAEKEKYCITDKYGNTSYFDTEGRLTRQSNNQDDESNIIITYTTTSSNLISTVTDGVGRVYYFTYGTNNLLTQIAYKGKVSKDADLTSVASITYVNFGYTNSNLTSVTDKDGKTSSYTYTTNNLLATAQDIDGYKICYDYTTTTAGQPNRIKTIEEYSGTTAGGVLNIEYAHNQTRFTDYNGNVQIVQFNNMGNTISIQDDQGRAQYAQYAINDPQKEEDTAPASVGTRSASTAKGNQLLLASKLQNTVGNIIKDSSFENGIVWGNTNSSVATCAISTEASYLGNSALKITPVNGTGEAGAYSSAFTIQPGETYTLSGYIKTDAETVRLGIGSNSAGYKYGERVSVDQDWTRVEYCYTNNTSVTQSVHALFLATGEGTTYVDCVQVEKAPTASRYNLVENGDFAYSNYAWNSSAGLTTVTAGNKAPAPQLDVNVYHMTGNPSGQNRISQTVKVSGANGDTFVLAGWAKADSVPIRDDREFALIASFKNGNTVVNTSIVRFNYCADSTIEWQYAASPIVAKGAFDSITIELAYDYNANSVYFDGIQLYKEEFGNSYTYDKDGNIISVKDVQSQTTTYEYTNNDLTAQVLPSGARLEYKYDTWHNVERATSSTGVVYNFAYDTYGNNISVSIVSDSVTLTSSADYTDDGNRLETTTDAAGKVTTYNYNENTNVLEWVKYPKDTDATRTEYTYDNMYRLAKAEADVSTGSTLKAEYGYTNDLLTSIKSGSTTYSFTYGAFALRSNIKIGNRTLAAYSYTDRNNFLDTLAYGNSDSVEYTYDKQGRVTKQTYEDGDTVIYKYDNSGALASTTDSATGITSTYYYDYTDRLLRYTEKGSNFSHIIGYEYDKINNLTALVETINGVEFRTLYGYDRDNRVTSVENENATETYTYDAYSRVSTKVAKNGDATVLTDTFTYCAPTATTTSGQIHELKSVAPGYNVTYTYTYDANGNIESVSDGTNTTSYVYDTANQLLRENNQAAGKTWVWTYDNAGNILSRSEYAYTTDELGEASDPVVYTYDDTTWGDLLTSYDEQTIFVDGIGNPVSDGKRSYDWEHGRELVRLFGQGPDGWNETTYVYNADGLRTEKTVTTMVFENVGTKTGLYVCSDGEIRYFTNGKPTAAGLVQDANGDYYYINSSLKAVRGSSYYATNVNGLLPKGEYTFGADGRMVVDEAYGQNGNLYTGLRLDTDGQRRYYVNGIPTYAGLVYADGYYYYINHSMVAVRSGTYEITYTNGLLPEGTYTFDSQGRMVNPPVAAATNSRATYQVLVPSTTVTYRYTYNGSNLSQMTAGSDTLNFAYDASGSPMAVTYNGTTYYYATNLQGDVTAILNTRGTAVVQYTYDAWGKILTTTGSMASTLGAHNPLRYRGYVYDTESTLYYLQSRYYDPELGRFINADNYPSTGQGLTGNNMFAYCGNNPISREDSGGTWWHLAVGALVGVVSQYVSDVVSSLASGDSLSEALVPTSSAVDYLAAAASGALAASGVGAFGSAIANATIDGMAYVANCGINGEKVDGFEFLFTVTASALSSGKGIDGANLRGVYQHSVDVLQTAISPKKIALYTAKKVNVVKTVLTEIGSSLWGAVKDGLWDGAKQQLGW